MDKDDMANIERQIAHDEARMRAIIQVLSGSDRPTPAKTFERLIEEFHNLNNRVEINRMKQQ